MLETNIVGEGIAIVKKALPIGVDLFEKMISKDYFYIDKTLFIKEILDNVFLIPIRNNVISLMDLQLWSTGKLLKSIRTSIRLYFYL